jgi:hypothetical protein
MEASNRTSKGPRWPIGRGSSLITGLCQASLLLIVALATTAVHADIGWNRTEEEVLARTGIRWEITPQDVVITLDSKELGPAGKVTFTTVEAGEHIIELRLGDRKKAFRLTVINKRVHPVKYNFEP